MTSLLEMERDSLSYVVLTFKSVDKLLHLTIKCVK